NSGECRMLTCAPKRPVRNGQAGNQTRFGESPPFCSTECRGSTGHHTFIQATGIRWWLFYCASHAYIKESLSAVSLGKPITFGGFAVRQAHA
ncbi:hypothetical protein, partial [Huaxiibacter chinensis]|uniref:hypothetical protein n=1 Tax=Huaxiibacter chinensis TaxID=2899785 RepID=UPI003D317CD2